MKNLALICALATLLAVSLCVETHIDSKNKTSPVVQSTNSSKPENGHDYGKQKGNKTGCQRGNGSWTRDKKPGDQNCPKQVPPVKSSGPGNGVGQNNQNKRGPSDNGGSGNPKKPKLEDPKGGNGKEKEKGSKGNSGGPKPPQGNGGKGDGKGEKKSPKDGKGGKDGNKQPPKVGSGKQSRPNTVTGM